MIVWFHEILQVHREYPHVFVGKVSIFSEILNNTYKLFSIPFSMEPGCQNAAFASIHMLSYGDYILVKTPFTDHLLYTLAFLGNDVFEFCRTFGKYWEEKSHGAHGPWHSFEQNFGSRHISFFSFSASTEIKIVMPVFTRDCNGDTTSQTEIVLSLCSIFRA